MLRGGSMPIALRAALIAAALLLALTATAYVATSASRPAVAQAADKDCADFKNQKRAQKFFKKHNPRRDPHNLDSDNDRKACEELRCPCSHRLHDGRVVEVPAVYGRIGA